MPIEAIDQVAGILVGSLLTALTACLLGRILFARLRAAAETLSGAEQWIFSLGLGAALLSNLVFLLCAAGLVYDASFVVVAVLTVTIWWRHGRSLPCVREFSIPANERFWWVVLLVTAGFYGYLYLPHALAPEISADGVGYHLGLVSHYYRHHGFPHITTNVYAYLSQGAEMLYLFAYAFGRHSAAKMVHFSFLIATVAAMLTFARRFGIWRAGIAGAVLYLCAPVVGIDAASTYNDCALAFYVFMTFYGLLLWWQNREAAWLPMLGILAGFCFAIKYTGFFAIPAVLTAVAWGTLSRLRSPRAALRRLVLVATVSSLFVLPWMVKNTILIGNPVAPFFNRFFPSPYVTVDWEQHYVEFLKHYSHEPEDPRWLELAKAPWEVTVSGVRFQGLLGPVFLLAPAALLAWRHPLARSLWAGAAISALPWLSNAGTRFLIPSLIFISLAIGLVLERLPRLVAALVGCAILLGHATSSWPWLLPKWHPEGIWALRGIPWKAALRLQPEQEYLARHVPYFRTAQILASQAPCDGRVLTLEPLPEAYIPCEVMVSYQGALNERIVLVLMTPIQPFRWPSFHVRLEFSPRSLRGFRIVQTNQHESILWSISEARFFHGGSEIIPQTDWRILAKPFPWTAARAFDGNAMTAWDSGRPVSPGMSLEVHFPEALQLDGAELIYPWSHQVARLEYFAQNANGEWSPLEVEAPRSLRPVSVARLKAWAGEEMKRNDIGYLVTNLAGEGYNTVAPEIEKDPAAWGLREIGQDGTIRIYRVEGWEELNRGAQ